MVEPFIANKNTIEPDDIILIDGKRVVKHEYKTREEFKKSDINIVEESDGTKPAM